MIIKIDALDTLFFKDGKPFSWGEDNWADGIFPPTPSTIYGALRAAYFAENPDKFAVRNTDVDPSLNLRINGFYIKLGEDICFISPKDTVALGKDELQKLHLIDNKTVSTNKLSQLFYFDGDEKVEYNSDAYLSRTDFKRYLTAKKDSFNYLDINNFKQVEPKIGIARNDRTHTSDEAKLYRVGMQRMFKSDKNYLSFVVDFEGIELPDTGLLKIGAEGKAVSYNIYDEIELSISDLDISKHFKLYLATPAIFENGWLPSWIDPDTFTGEFKGIKLKLVSAAVGKPQKIGGFDMKTKKPKAMRNAVHAGSVYCFELLEGDGRQVLDLFNNKTISEFGTGKEGYGLTFVGVL